jgi:hypothetical protein
MALREFTDRTGCRWRVWDIRPEEMHAATRAEDYLQSVIHGWLAFEPVGGGEKRRLSPIPAGWEKASETELDRMLDRAESVRADVDAASRTDKAASREARPRDASPPARPTPVPTIRTFRYPNGRYWTVHEQADAIASEWQRPLLRFTSGARYLETREWPSDWAGMSENELADLLHRSFPRDPSTRNLTEFRRRRGETGD